MGSVVLYVAKNKLAERWLPYYWLMPIEGAGMALFIFLLTGSSWMNGNGAPGGGAASAAVATDLNGLWLLAGLSGLFSKNVTKKLADVADVLFGKPSKENSLADSP